MRCKHNFLKALQLDFKENQPEVGPDEDSSAPKKFLVKSFQEGDQLFTVSLVDSPKDKLDDEGKSDQ